jgi:hypothetical protein
MAGRARLARDTRRRRSSSARRSSASAWRNSSLNIGCIVVSSRLPVPGMTSCPQRARHAGRPSVTGPTPPLSACGHLMIREAARSCRLLDGYEVRQSMHLTGALPVRQHPGDRRDASGQACEKAASAARTAAARALAAWPAGQANATASPVTPRTGGTRQPSVTHCSCRRARLDGRYPPYLHRQEARLNHG